VTTARALVLDSNILIRAVLGKRVRDIIAGHSEQVVLLAPAEAFEEAGRHLPALLAKRGVDPGVAAAAVAELPELVQLVELKHYEHLREEALERIAVRDPDDWPVVALALATGAAVWTEDQDFFGSGVATWTTDRVELCLRNAGGS
jgi:predicted nucleic acid-binding protein